MTQKESQKERKQNSQNTESKLMLIIIIISSSSIYSYIFLFLEMPCVHFYQPVHWKSPLRFFPIWPPPPRPPCPPPSPSCPSPWLCTLGFRSAPRQPRSPALGLWSLLSSWSPWASAGWWRTGCVWSRLSLCLRTEKHSGLTKTCQSQSCLKNWPRPLHILLPQMIKEEDANLNASMPISSVTSMHSY